VKDGYLPHDSLDGPGPGLRKGDFVPGLQVAFTDERRGRITLRDAGGTGSGATGTRRTMGRS